MLWVDKYRPHTLDKVMVHVEEAQRLKQLVGQGDCPHLLFFGPSGAGKKTLIMALLREVYGSGAEKIKVENKPWKIEAGTRKLEVELTTISSNYHVELNPSDAGFQDRYVVQEVIKEMAKSRPLDVAGNKSYKDTPSSSSAAVRRSRPGNAVGEAFPDSRPARGAPSGGDDRQPQYEHFLQAGWHLP
ncbi:hypothetical protein L7F22_030511 [Adiantum nelumboides]|nr:hypothetical protein [Adiantum nelumboides]